MRPSNGSAGCPLLRSRPPDRGNHEERDILAPAGSFCAYEAFRRLELSDSAALFIGLASYNHDDVARLLDSLTEFVS